MKFWIFCFFFLLIGCNGIQIPPSYQYKEIQTSTYKLASWQKMTDMNQPVRIYIEGDGHSFNYAGQPTSDPTPKGTFLRELVFKDTHPNVVYLARPCQYVKDSLCSKIDWTTGRFSKKIVEALRQAIQGLSNKKPVVLIGYSGGALLSGLVIQTTPELKVEKWITLAGVLNHKSWTSYFNDAPLVDSLDLEKLPKVKQEHFVGEKDTVVPLNLAQTWSKVRIIPNATHNAGWEGITF